jgi:hypothetical protein
MNVGLSAWIIQDGNYGDFESRQSYRFALEFYSEDFSPSAAGPTPCLRPVAGANYDAVGAIIRATDSDWVVDFGVPAFQKSKPPNWAKPGLAVHGKVYIGIDPFFYFEELKDEVGMPDLIREWRVRRILLETTPWTTSTDSQGRRIISRASVPPTFKEVEKTYAWHDDKGNGHYILECDLQAG